MTMGDNSTAVSYATHSNISMSMVIRGPMDFTPREWILVTGLSLMILCVIFGNILILAAVATHRPLKTPPVYLIASLAMADLMVGLMVMPLSLTYELTVEWEFGVALCDFWISLDVLCCTASILNLCIIALDRYWAITMPLKYKLKRTPLRMLAMIAVAWAISLLISTSPLFGWHKESEDPLTCKISQDRVFTIFSTFGAFFIPMTIMLVVYARIFVEARKRIRGKVFQSPAGSSCASPIKRSTGESSLRIAALLRQFSTSEPVIGDLDRENTTFKPLNRAFRRRSSVPGMRIPQSAHHVKVALPSPLNERTVSMSSKQSQHQSSQCIEVPCSPFLQQRLMQRRNLASAREQKAVKTLAIITGTFLICWLPFFIATLVVPFCQHCNLPAFWKSLFLWLGYSNSMINPILYTKFNKDFKNAFRKLLHCSPRNHNNPSSYRRANREKKSPMPAKLQSMNGTRVT